MRQIILAVLMGSVMCSGCFGEEAKQAETGVGLTIYNENFAVVREARQMEFEQGVNTVKFTDVASAIDPTSVHFTCLSSQGAVKILEQNYEYDLVDGASLLKRYIDKAVTVWVKGSGANEGRDFNGTLLAAIGNDLILKGSSGVVEIIDRGSVEDISLAGFSGELVTKPTLIWLAESKEKANLLCQVAYTTGQLGWHADYLAVLDANKSKIDFSGWVTIDNKSGAAYKDARLKLIAGEVRRVMPPVPQQPRDMMYAMKAEAAAAGFEEKPFMEYHLYTLGRKSTIKNNEVKQIEFISPVEGVGINKIYIYEKKPKWFYDNQAQKDKVQTKIEFENSEQNRLGMALPMGKVRVFKKDPADNMLEFVGEDEIDHTPKKEKVSLYIGDAFDIVPEYTLLDSRYSDRYSRETHKIEMRNRKSTPVVVYVEQEFIDRHNWNIDSSTMEYKKKNARTVRFELKVDADSTAAVEYTVSETW